MTLASVTEDSWRQEVLNADKPMLVDFWASWCGPCRMMNPILEQLSKAHEGEYTVVKVNVDENPDLSAAFNVTSIPTLLVFDQGEVKARIVGVRTLPALEQEAKQALA